MAKEGDDDINDDGDDDDDNNNHDDDDFNLNNFVYTKYVVSIEMRYAGMPILGNELHVTGSVCCCMPSTVILK